MKAKSHLMQSQHTTPDSSVCRPPSLDGTLSLNLQLAPFGLINPASSDNPLRPVDCSMMDMPKLMPNVPFILPHPPKWEKVKAVNTALEGHLLMGSDPYSPSLPADIARGEKYKEGLDAWYLAKYGE